MSSNLTILIILILNIIVAFCVMAWDISKDNGNFLYIHLFVILFAPVIGITYFLCSFWLEHTLFSDKDIAYGDISFDSSRHIKKLKGNFLEEIDILPLEEAFAVSGKKDRRYALLSTLKKDYGKNISTVLLGLNNEDSETSHYAATVVLATTTDYLNIIGKLKEEYLEARDQHRPDKNYLIGLKEFMESDIMDAIDKEKYARMYVEVLEWLYENFKDEIVAEDFVFSIQILIELNDYETAAKWSGRAIRTFPEEDMVYYYTMKMYYCFGDSEHFLKLLKELMSSTINISNETLQIIRFFTYSQR